MSNTRNKSRAYLALLLALGLAPTLWASSQTTFRWLDENGRVTYGDHPPTGVEAEKIRISTGTSSSGKNVDASPTDAKPGNKDVHASTAVKVSPAEAKNLCEQARNNLEVLENHALIRQTDENGDVRVLEESEKKEQIKTAKQISRDYCKG